MAHCQRMLLRSPSAVSTSVCFCNCSCVQPVKQHLSIFHLLQSFCWFSFSATRKTQIVRIVGLERDWSRVYLQPFSLSTVCLTGGFHLPRQDAAFCSSMCELRKQKGKVRIKTRVSIPVCPSGKIIFACSSSNSPSSERCDHRVASVTFY